MTDQPGFVPEEDAQLVRPAVSLERYVEEWHAHLLALNRSPVYARISRTTVRTFIHDTGVRVPGDVTVAIVRRWLDAMNTSTQTKNKRRSQLSVFFRFVGGETGNGWTKAKNPAAATDKYGVIEQARYYTPTEAEVLALVETVRHMPGKKTRWLVYHLAATTGLRRSAINGLRRAHVKLEGGPAKIALPPSLAKNRRAATLYLPSDTEAHLRWYLETFPGRQVLFTTPKANLFKGDLRLAGLPTEVDGRSFCFHSLRHFFATRMAALSVPEEFRQRAMTHGSLAMTEHYTDRANEMMAQTIRNLPPLGGQTKPAGEKKSAETSSKGLTSGDQMDEDATSLGSAVGSRDPPDGVSGQDDASIPVDNPRGLDGVQRPSETGRRFESFRPCLDGDNLELERIRLAHRLLGVVESLLLPSQAKDGDDGHRDGPYAD